MISPFGQQIKKPLKNQLLLQRLKRGKLMAAEDLHSLTSFLPKRCKAINGSDAKIKDQDERSGRTAVQERNGFGYGLGIFVMFKYKLADVKQSIKFFIEVI